MARLRTCRNAPPPASEDELAGDVPEAVTEGSGTSTHTPTASRAPTPAPAPAPTPAPGPPGRYTDEDLQRATKLALELLVKGQEHGQLQASTAPYERPPKAWFPDLYYGNSHLDCYRFCQWCEDHFETAGVNGPNQISFAPRSSADRWSSAGTSINVDPRPRTG